MASVGLRGDGHHRIEWSLVSPPALILLVLFQGWRRRSLRRHLLGQEAAGLARP
jgi:hypothetical protein